MASPAGAENMSQPLLPNEGPEQDWRSCALDAGKKAEQREKGSAMKKLRIAIVLCFIFMIAELVGGYFANSLAIMSDAAHLLSDIAGFGVSLFAVHITKFKSPQMTFGFGRAEVLGALLSVITIWMVTGALVYEAVNRIIAPRDVDGRLMFIIASLGVVVNLCLFFVLGEDGHSHSHGHHHHHDDHSDHDDHHHDDHSDHDDHHHHDHDGDEEDGLAGGRSGGRKRNMNVRSAWLHAIGDLLQNIGVMIAAGIIWWNPEWKIADPITTLLFCCFVVWTTKALVGDIFNILMQRVPVDSDPADIAQKIGEVEGVQRVFDMHIWSLTPGQSILSVHIECVPGSSCAGVTAAVEELLKKEGIDHVTIQTH
uniref:Solute carrier family 30 (Zinc transporter), member 2 n=1 Tax=Tetraselmis sp. GSL018 TaxID=582737 RepID=A0A061R921_9CHLO